MKFMGLVHGAGSYGWFIGLFHTAGSWGWFIPYHTANMNHRAGSWGWSMGLVHGAGDWAEGIPKKKKKKSTDTEKKSDKKMSENREEVTSVTVTVSRQEGLSRRVGSHSPGANLASLEVELGVVRIERAGGAAALVAARGALRGHPTGLGPRCRPLL